jgi:putative mRNA 3-end processing factor
MSLLTPTPAGLYCSVGDFYIDPCRQVERAIITHAHSDHARRGCRHYLAARPSRDLLRQRLGKRANIETLRYGETVNHRGVRVSLHPAGHILGSAQVRLEYAGEVWVVSGDYKLQPDPTCDPFEPIRCDVFCTECTFGLPCYRWPPPQDEIARLEQWWQANQQKAPLALCLRIVSGRPSAFWPASTPNSARSWCIPRWRSISRPTARRGFGFLEFAELMILWLCCTKGVH